MGIDWSRVKVKRKKGRAQLSRLIEQQAIAFQSMWGWGCEAYTDGVWYELCERLHIEVYRGASEALRESFVFPEWDDDRSCATDVPDLVPCLRTYPITRNPIFPPLWCMRANRTFLPDQLGAQLAEWRSWAEQVADGKQDDYIRELHMYVTSDFMRNHWSYLRAIVIKSLTRRANWSKKPALVEVRERILRLPEPTVSKVRIEPTEERPWNVDEFDAPQYASLFRDLRTLIELTRAWDSNVPRDFKLRYYEDYYSLTLDEFRNRARDSWLQEFFEWADRCVQHGFGLFLDF